MSAESFLLIGIIWVAANAFFPLILNSIERRYEKQIDSLVRGMVSVSWSVMVRFIQLVLVLLRLPSFVLVVILEQIYPRAFTLRYLSDIRVAKQATLSKDFPKIYVTAFHNIRNRRKEGLTNKG
jgi:hypothetical protein